MAYDSPSTIRRRQNAANDKAARPRRTRKTKSEIEQQRAWESRRDYHLSGLIEKAEQGHCESAGRHAQASVHALIQWRATEIMRERNCDYLTAAPDARVEVLGKEPLCQ